VPFAAPLLDTRLNGTVPDRHGKVRDLFDLGDRLLLVATDRISAFDYVLGSGIPAKGKVLTQLSAFWFAHTASIVPNHVLSTDMRDLPASFQPHRSVLDGRSMIVRKTQPLAIECVARGYLSGSGWKEYQAAGAVCGVPLPAGLRESDRLPRAIFTPATKASTGHDINISEAEAGTLIGEPLVARVRDLTLAAPVSAAAAGGDGKVRAAMNGRVVAVLVKPGEQVTLGQPVMTLEAMKMEHVHTAGVAGTVSAIDVAEGEQVTTGKIVVEIEAVV